MTLHFLNDAANDIESTRNVIIARVVMGGTMAPITTR